MTTPTQNETVLKHLRKFGSITPREAYDDYQIMRLASRVDELRKAGLDIETEMRKHQITGKRYAKYHLK